MVASDQLARLMAIVQDCYLLAREQVFDHFPPGAPIDADVLTPRQIAALDELAAAEAELATYRRESYALA